MRAKQFFYAAAGILLLVTAYTVGSHRAEAQISDAFVGITCDSNYGKVLAITANGQVYARAARISCDLATGQLTWREDENCHGWQHMGSVLGPVAVTPATMSGVKQNYKK